MSTSPAKPKRAVHYPDSDGKPMGETGIHVNATMELFGTIKWAVFAHRPDVYVAANMFFYYEEGNPRAVKAPDIMVIKGVAHPEERRSFKLWVEGRVPSVVFEFSSRKTRRDDTTVKVELYARLGIAEYFLFDPLGEYLQPSLLGYRLEGDHYEPMAREPGGGYFSPGIGLNLRAVKTRVRLFNPVDGEMIPDMNEAPGFYLRQMDLGYQLAEERKAQRELEREVETEKRNADSERRRADDLAAEVERLRAMLGKRGENGSPKPDG
jgi:Uma2 family endonuclease